MPEPVFHQPLSNDRQQISDHIARLQQRQQELVQETTAELELLRHKLNESESSEEHVNRARQPLLAEIEALRKALVLAEDEKQHLGTEVNRLQSEYHTHYSQMQNALVALQNSMRHQAPTFTEKVKEQEAEEKPMYVPPAPPVHFEPVRPTLNEITAPVYEPPKTPKPPRSWTGMRKLAVRTFAFALIGSVAWGSWQAIANHRAATPGVVAGVSTTTPSATSDPNSDNPAEKYKESYAILPFDQTVWETYTDPDFGFSVRYPKNTTNKVKTIGGSNIWFLRFDSYLMKFTSESATDTLEDWWQKSQGFYSSDNSISKGIFKGRPAWIAKPTVPTTNSGTTYAFSTKTGIMTVWVKDEDPLTDDGQRITKMVDSISFGN